MTKKVRTTIIFLNLIMTILIGMNRDQYRLDALSFCVIPLVAAILFISYNKIRLFEDRRIVIFSILLSILFMIMVSTEQIIRLMLQMDNDLVCIMLKSLFFPIVYCSTYISINCILQSFLYNHKNNVEMEDTDSIFYNHPMWLIAVVTIFFSLAYFPGEIGNDLVSILDDIEHGVWNDWHTIAFMMLVKLCCFGTKRVFGITIIQMICFIMAQNYAVSYLYKRFANRRITFVYAVVSITMGLIAYRYIPSVCKDITFFEVVFTFSISILGYIQSEGDSRKDYIKIVIFGFLTAIFRHLMIVMVCLTMLTLIIYMISKRDKRSKNICISAGVLVLVYIIFTQVIAFGVLEAKPNPKYVKYSIPMNLIGSMAYRYTEGIESLDDDTIEIMEEIMPLEKWAECYYPYDCDPIAREYGEVGTAILKLNDDRTAQDVIKLNIYFLLHHSKSFVLSFFDANSLVWEIASPTDGVEYIPTGSIDFTNILHMRKGDFYYLSENLINFLYSNPISRSIYFRGGASTFSIIFVILVFWLKKRKREMIALLPMIIYILLLMVSIPQPQTRYIFPITQYVIFFGVYIYYEKQSKLQGD